MKNQPVGALSRKPWVHRLFQAAIAIKGIDGVLEVMGGIAMLIFGPTRLNHLLTTLSQRELHEDAHDVIANFIARHTHFTGSGVHFAALYLIFQGTVKIWLAEALLRERRWVFPWAILLLLLFQLYIGFEFVQKRSPGLLFLGLLNLIIIILIALEYRRTFGPPSDDESE